MTINCTRSLYSVVLATTLLTACSRPVAYFQPGLTDPSPTASSQTTVLAKPAQRFTESIRSIDQVQSTVDSPEAYARQDSRRPASTTPANRIARIGTMLALPTATQRLAAPNAPHKLTGIERLVLRRVNKQISKQLAPSHPEKALIKRGKLIGSIVLLAAGLLMLILGTGTVAFIGLFVSLIGAAGIIVSLIGIDS